MMQKNRQRKPGASLFRGFFRFLLALVVVFGGISLGLLVLTVLMRQKVVNDKVRLLSKRGNAFARKIAGTRLGSLYFNLSALKHVGRSSGREYVTPLSAYPLGDGFVFALAYGPNVDWCRNIMASGKCTLIWKGQEYALEKPELLPISTTVALSWRNTTLKPVWEQNWFERSARRGVGLKRGGHLFQASDGQMRGLAQTVGVALPVDASIGHPTGSPLVA